MVFKSNFHRVIIRASLGSENINKKRKPNDLFDAPNRLQICGFGAEKKTEAFGCRLVSSYISGVISSASMMVATGTFTFRKASSTVSLFSPSMMKTTLPSSPQQ